MRFFYSFVLTTSLLPGIGVPTLGYIYDSEAMAVRPLLGTRGAAIPGQPLDFGFRLASAAVASQLQFVLAASADDNRVRLVILRGERSEARLLEGVMAAPDRMILSPSGRAAILHSASEGKLQVLTGLPDAVSVAREWATADLGAIFTSAAVSDDGDAVLFASGEGELLSLWRFKETERVRIPLHASTAAVGFRPNSHEALAVTGDGELYFIAQDGATSQYGLIAGNAPAIPVGVQLSSDGKLAYIAYSQGAIATFNSITGITKTVFCDCKPTSLQPMNSQRVFRVNELSASPLFLLDASQPEPRLWFVPPYSATSEVKGSAQ